MRPINTNHSPANFPAIRMRRLRSTNFIRKLVEENTLTTNDLIYPVFIINSKTKKQEISAMPGQYRYNLDGLLELCEEIVNLNITAIALFPVIEQELKTIDGKEALNPNGLVPKAVKLIKQNFPALGVITDIALDPYTSHGQDGIIDQSNYILNDQTIDILVQQALIHSDAGVDIVAPSDMMDGRIGAIRLALEENNFINTAILAYSAKFASNYYGPFRDAVQSAANLGKADKTTYQVSFANSQEAIREIALDIQEGADIVMVKPGMPYLDIIYKAKQEFNIPIFAYNVSGEYTMHKLAFDHGLLDKNKTILESLISFKRAGANAILTYFALDAARLLIDLHS